MATYQILIVDDDELVRDALKLTLSRTGHEIAEAADGREALQACARRQPDLIITDLMMPGLHGDRLIAEYGRAAPDSKVIVISGEFAEPSDLTQFAGRTDVDAVFAKPIDPDELLAAVVELLQSS